MLSGIVTIPVSCVHGPFPARVLLRSLTALVPAAVTGVLGDLTIATPTGIEGLEDVAHHAGCRLVEATSTAEAIISAISEARQDGILVLAMGRAPNPGFHLELDGLLRAGIQNCLMREEPGSLLQRLFPALSPVAMVAGPRHLLGKVISKATSGREMETMARHLTPGRIMKARAIVVEGDG